jgi:hypothetical protein
MEIKGIQKQNILPSGMLMQEAEVRSSAGQHVRSHSSKNMAVFLKCVRPQLEYVRTQRCTAPLSRVRARTQMRDGRSQLREHPGIGSSAFDSKHCVRPHCRCLMCPETKIEQQKKLKDQSRN